MSQDRRNYILGAGELLVETVLPSPRAPQERRPYSLSEARDRIATRASAIVASIQTMPSAALPGGEAVAALTLHPQFLSKSAFPGGLLAEVGLRAVGSKPSRVTPEKVDRKSEPREEATSTVYVAGKLDSFRHLSAVLERPLESIPAKVAENLTAVEDFRAVTREDRLAGFRPSQEIKVLECVLHAHPTAVDGNIVRLFEGYAESLGLRVDSDNELFASGLCFLAVSGDFERLEDLALFSFLRRVRPMPRMRPLLPSRISRAAVGVPVHVPSDDPLDTGLAAAVFDTPLPAEHVLTRYVIHHEHGVEPYADADERLHGLCVASAATLGPLDNLQGGRVPYVLHHHGVLGVDTDGSGYLAALKTIKEQVIAGNYPLFNLSFGPDGAIYDDEIDPFTAVVDDLTSKGERLCFVAVGNDGELDADLALNRIQPPSDAVNSIAVGATNSRQSSWQRADYSCVGPGRHGCRVKPDCVTFGGSMDEPFGCIGPNATPDRYNTQGTSFSSPSAMRTAGGILATMGEQLSPIAVKALLLHGCRLEERDRRDVGHGLVESELANLLTSDPNEVKVIFQGSLVAGKYLQHKLPLPPDLAGMVELKATLCFASPVDSSFPATYVRAGVEAIFRPHSEKFGTITDPDGSKRPSTTVLSDTLFNQGGAYGMSDDRRDAHLWDTVLKVTKTKRSTSLHNPVIELHYNRRQEGQPDSATNQPDIPYALVLTIRCRAVNDLYDRVRARFGANVRVLAPRIEIPIRT